MFIRVEGISVPKFKKRPSHELAKQISHAMYNETMNTFQIEGPGWTPLKPATIKQRLKRNFGTTILDRKRGNLGLRLGIIQKPTNDEAIVGVRSGIEYARIHQLGGVIQRQPFSSSVFLRTNKKGELLRQKNYDKLAVFARRKHKLFIEKKFKSSGFTIIIPARKYLKFTSALYRHISVLVKKFYQ